VDLVLFAAEGEAEAVVFERGGEERADLVRVAREWEGAGEEAFQLGLEAILREAGIRQALKQVLEYEGPQTVVSLTKGFYMGKYNVTQGEYLAVVGSNPSYFNTNNGYSLDLTRPVEQMSWYEATNYCAMLTQQEAAAGRIPRAFRFAR
jgi:formylglycine-generating enzyme required for sulfatase activity